MGALNKISKSPSTTSTSSSVTNIAALPRMVGGMILWLVHVVKKGGHVVMIVSIGGSGIEIWPCPLLVVISIVWLRVRERFHRELLSRGIEVRLRWRSTMIEMVCLRSRIISLHA